MKPVTGHVNENGKLELGQLPDFPPGEDLRVLIMDAADIAVLEKMIDVVANTEGVDAALLAQLEALDEALWDAQFAESQDILTELAEQARSEHEQGKTEELDLDELNRNDV